MRRGCLAVAGIVALLATVSAHDRTSTRVTWDREISRIVQARCVTCHRAGGRAPMALGTYADARPWARAIREEVLTRRMPKWHAVRGYGDIANDPSLSPFEIAIVTAWVDGGAPEKPAAANAVPAPQPTAIAQPDAAPPRTRTVATTCADSPLPPGRLLGLRPQLEAGGSAGVAIEMPDGRRDLLVWVRNFEPAFEETYWLRTPIDTGRGSRLHVEATSRCAVLLVLQDR